MKYLVTWKEARLSLEKGFKSLKEARAFKKYLLKDETIDQNFVVIWMDGMQVQ